MQKIIYGCIILFILTLFDVYSFGLDTAAAVFSSSLKSTLHLSDFSVSIAVGSFIVGYVLMQVPAGFLLDKFNLRYIVSSGILLLVIGNIAISFAHNVFLFSLFNLLQGIGSAFAFTALAIATCQWFPEKLFPILLGLTQTLSFILTALLHYTFTIALAYYAWNDIYLMLAMGGFILFLVAIALVKSPRIINNESSYLSSSH